MPLSRTVRLQVTALVAIALFATLLPAPTAAAEPTLGPAVTLEDGTTLPPMPAELLAPSVAAEMLAQHGDVTATVASGGEAIGIQALENAGGVVQAAEPLVTVANGATGPAGPLPNGLTREVLGFLPYWKVDSATRSALRLDLLSTIAYFSIGVGADGALARGTSDAPTIGWSRWTSSAMTELINAAHSRGVRVVPTVTMMAWDYDYGDMTTLLTSPTNRARLVGEIVAMVRDRRADGVNVDFEPVPASLRSQFTQLVREIKAGLVSAMVGSFVTVDTMAGAATWSTGYDVAALSSPGAADALMVMAYDFHYAGSARAGGVAPMESDHIFAAGDALRDYLAWAPPGRLIWGVPHYGRAWNTTTTALNSPVRSPAQSVAFSYYWNDGGTPAGGKILAQRYGRRWDATGQVPWFAFWDAGSGGYRQGYYEDPESLGIKYDAINRHDLAGAGIWSLGMDTGVSDLWDVIAGRFRRVVHRLAGADRYATAAAISQASFGAGVPVAYVATGASFPDALAGGPAAARAGAPVLLTGRSSLPGATTAELARLRPTKIVVLGGTGVVSPTVASALAPYATSGVVERLAGADRYATAASVSASTFPAGVPVAYVATGQSFPDALAGGVAAGRENGPILLVTGSGIPSATAAELARLKPARIVALGGTGVIPNAVVDGLTSFTTGAVTRLAGPDRYATAIAISQATTASGAGTTVYVATGSGFPDGLAGTPAAARSNGPLLLVRPDVLTAEVAAELRRIDPQRVVILGGTGAVSAQVAAQIAAVWNQ